MVQAAVICFQVMPLWWNWQTRTTQNRVALQPCRFDSDQRHHLDARHNKAPFRGFLFVLRRLVQTWYW